MYNRINKVQKEMSSSNKNQSIYPDFWNDDSRMSVLFAPFRSKLINAESYESKLNFWKNMIKKYCEVKGSAQFCKSDLLLSFQRKEKSPTGLDTVLEDMFRNREIKTLEKFNEDIEDGWSLWALKTLIKKPLVWGIQQAIGIENGNHNAQCVHEAVLQEQSACLLMALQNFPKKILTNKELERLDNVNLNDEGRILCLRYLHYLKKIHVEFKIQNGIKTVHIIKVPNGGIVTPLTDLEWTVYNLENTRDTLNKCIGELHDEMKTCEESARSYIRGGNRSLAKACLRKKHVVEKNLEKRIIARDNIDTLLINLQDAQDNGVVLNAIKMGSNTMKELFKHSDMNIDNVDEIILEVKETLEMNDDIQKTVSEPLIEDNFDEASLERELEDILSTNNDEKIKQDIPEKVKEFTPEIVKQITTEKGVDKELPKENKETDEKLSEEDKEVLKQLEELEIGNLSQTSNERLTPVPFP